MRCNRPDRRLWYTHARTHARKRAHTRTQQETTPEIQKIGQILEMSQILGRAFKHSEKADARQMFDAMDEDGNGTIDLKELINGLQMTGMHVAWMAHGR